MIKKYRFEALSDKQKKVLRNLGAVEEPVEELDFGDYSLYLMDNGNMSSMIGAKYQLGLQRKDTEFTNMNHQSTKYSFNLNSIPFMYIPKIIRTVKEWINKYDDIMFSSYNNEKVEKYIRLLKLAKINYDIRSIHGHKIVVLRK